MTEQRRPRKVTSVHGEDKPCGACGSKLWIVKAKYMKAGAMVRQKVCRHCGKAITTRQVIEED